jgi:acetolactate synthase I/II/III large subunit
MAKGQAPEEGSSFVGVVGRARSEMVAEYCKPADLIIAVGYDPVEFNYEEWVQKDVPIVHIDTVRADRDRGHSVPCNVVGDLRGILNALSSVPPLRHQWDFQALREHRRKLRQALTPARERFSPHHAVVAIRDLFPKEGILAADVGAHTHLIGQLWETDRPGTLLVSNGWSSMGFGIPAAISAKLVQPDRPVLACVGDGGFLMMVGEINTAVRLRLPVVFVLLRDNCLSLIKGKQSRKRFQHHGVEIFGPDYRPSDTFFGANVVPVDTEESFRVALKQALQGSGPVIIDAKVDPTEYEAMI